MSYESERIEFAVWNASNRASHKIADRYRADLEVTVYYDPQKPSSSVLDRNVKWGPITFTLVVATSFLVAGIYFVVPFL